MEIMPTHLQQALAAGALAAAVPPPRRPEPDKSKRVADEEARIVLPVSPTDGQHIGRHLDLKV